MDRLAHADAVNWATSSMLPTMLALSSASSSAGIQYSRIVWPPTWCTSYRSKKSLRTSNRVTYPAPLALTFQSRAMRVAYSSFSTGLKIGWSGSRGGHFDQPLAAQGQLAWTGRTPQRDRGGLQHRRTVPARR